MVETVRTTSEHADFRSLIGELDADLNSRYGDLQKQYDGFNKIEEINTVVLVRDNDKAIGCGCFKVMGDDTVEIKRVFLRKEHRGNGIADRILRELELWAAELGYTSAVLETGKGQPEAIRFYTRLGYAPIPNYGHYAGNDNSVCMRKSFLHRF